MALELPLAISVVQRVLRMQPCTPLGPDTPWGFILIKELLISATVNEITMLFGYEGRRRHIDVLPFEVSRPPISCKSVSLSFWRPFQDRTWISYVNLCHLTWMPKIWSSLECGPPGLSKVSGWKHCDGFGRNTCSTHFSYEVGNKHGIFICSNLLPSPWRLPSPRLKAVMVLFLCLSWPALYGPCH